jgi:hypothetical protein
VLIGGASLERNDDLDLDMRLSASGSAVWYPKRSARGRWGVGGGLVESREQYFGEEEANTSILGSLMLTGDYDRFGPFGTNASGQIVWLRSFDGSGRHRTEFRGSVRQKIYSDFTFTVSPYYSFDSKPPRSDLESEDWGWVSSIGWNF